MSNVCANVCTNVCLLITLKYIRDFSHSKICVQCFLIYPTIVPIMAFICRTYHILELAPPATFIGMTPFKTPALANCHILNTIPVNFNLKETYNNKHSELNKCNTYNKSIYNVTLEVEPIMIKYRQSTCPCYSHRGTNTIPM